MNELVSTGAAHTELTFKTLANVSFYVWRDWQLFNISTCQSLFIDCVWIFQEDVLQEQERLKEEQCNIQKRSEQLLSIMQQFKGMWRHCLHGNRRGRRPEFCLGNSEIINATPLRREIWVRLSNDD